MFFDIPPTTDRFLVDLPGYGYAKVPQDLQAHWQAFLDGYFGSRHALRGLVVVMDIRHPLKEYDRQMLGYAVERGLPAHALLTKADKLSRGAQGNALLAVRKELASAFGDTVSVQTFSGESKLGVDQARAVFGGWLELQALRSACQEACRSNSLPDQRRRGHRQRAPEHHPPARRARSDGAAHRSRPARRRSTARPAWSAIVTGCDLHRQAPAAPRRSAAASRR